MVTGIFNAYAEVNQKVLIVANTNEEPYAQVIKGFKAQLAESNHFTLTELFKPTAADITQHISQDNPNLIFAVGREATELAQQNSAAIPMVSTLVLKESIFKLGKTTGVSLTYPFTTQIQWLKKFFPEQTKIAVLFNPAENAETIQRLKKVTEPAGLRLIAIPVESPRQLPDALEQLANNVDVLLTIQDEIALSPQTVKEVLLASFRNRVPMVGLSENWVKSGALYALSWDYDDLGRQCAVQAQKIGNGQTVQSIPSETPRKMIYTINTKIAEHMNIDISGSLIQNAKILFH
ncbi:MAG: hypothetical protein NTV00_12325 [Methylococcales bacterium]|nr:hypothetical protein [Methylococcales bacterium]